jgi:hypothetical protein
MKVKKGVNLKKYGFILQKDDEWWYSSMEDGDNKIIVSGGILDVIIKNPYASQEDIVDKMSEMNDDGVLEGD